MLNISGRNKTFKRAIMATFLATFLILSGMSGIKGAFAMMEEPPAQDRDEYEQIDVSLEIIESHPNSGLWSESEAIDTFNQTFYYCDDIHNQGGCAYVDRDWWLDGIFIPEDPFSTYNSGDEEIPSPTFFIYKNEMDMYEFGTYNHLNDDQIINNFNKDGDPKNLLGDWLGGTPPPEEPEEADYIITIEEGEPAPSQPFDEFEASTLQPEEYSLNEYLLNAEVLDFGSYDFEESEDHLARGIEIFDNDGELIDQPAMEIIDDFETPAEFDYLFTAEDGESYGYRWRFAYVDNMTGQTIDTYRTDLETFSHQVDEDAPDIETEEAEDINDDSAELRGQVNDLGDTSDLDISFEWKEESADNWNETDTVATLDDSFSYPATVWEVIEDLEKETNYNFRIKANDYRGNIKTFTTSAEPIDDPDPPPPEDWEDWDDFYNLQADDEFSEPVGVIDTIGGTFHGMMNAITSRIEPFSDQIETDQAYNYGKEAGEFIPTMRGYLIELRPFFGGLPVAEVFLFFLIFEVAILGIKGVMIALGFLPFF